MNCFNHTDRQAVGLCKHCNKGLCHECAADLGYGLACKDTHEPEIERMNALTARAASSGLFLPLLFGFMGLVFTGWGLVLMPGGTFPLLMGVGFLVFAIVVFFVNKRASLSRRGGA